MNSLGQKRANVASRSERVVFIGQLPPPVNGLTFITSQLIATLSRTEYDLIVTNTTSDVARRNVLFHMSRLCKTLRGLLSIALNALTGNTSVCYFTADGGFGLLYTILIATLSRLFGYRLYIHHHNYSYINRDMSLMRLFLSIAGPQATQICLSERMALDLAARYQRELRVLVLSNAVFVPETPGAIDNPLHEVITIGLLSNLAPDKGLYEFLEVLRLAKERALPMRGVLAGPVREVDRVFLQSLSEELSGFLEYRGPVYAEDKKRFFQDIDVFVFASTYRNEAQPTVLFEAMANAIPVIAFDCGAIRSQVGEAGFVFPKEAKFVTLALDVLGRYSADRRLLESHRRAALNRHVDERRAGVSLISRLFDVPPRILGVVS